MENEAQEVTVLYHRESHRDHFVRVVSVLTGTPEERQSKVAKLTDAVLSRNPTWRSYELFAQDLNLNEIDDFC
jgi:hypothetical protein